MKQLIKDFLFKKRIKILRNKKGFSLLEVLIAVGIIAIISAIAVPQYTANRENAARVAGDTSITNIEKAYKHCIALNSHGDCDSLSSLKVTCPDCNDGRDSGGTKFCAQIQKTTGGKTFRACVDFEDGSTVGRAYGGSMFKNIKLCHYQVSGCTGGTGNVPKQARKGAIECVGATDVGVNKKCGKASIPGGNSCTTTNSCDPITESKAVCGSGTGVCTR